MGQLPRPRIAGYLASIGVTVVATGICFAMYGHFELSNLVMIYLIGVVLVASKFGPREAVLTSILSVVTFDFLFVQPRWTFAVSHTQDLLTLAVMTGVALLIGTLTLRVRQQSQAAADARHLAETERIRSTLLASISHDLRTPLTSIAGAAESLSQGKGHSQDLAETIFEESRKLTRQVENLLEMTRLQWGKVKPNMEWQSVEELIGSALGRAERFLSPREITVDIPDGLPLVRADALLLDRVFSNLLENVAKHTPETASVQVMATQHGGKIRIAVSDTGPGIPPGREEAIFQRFEQAGRNHGGAGLGLAVSREIVRLHNGDLRAENQPQGGASFIVELPVEREQPELPVEPEPSSYEAEREHA